eukprot:TRINITY_DN45829_c0_g1_i1.p1 TRINITY_DN45829_c0_g1~~TRINITY_DN45829_c0_g1_i1.p1  ORF type:complete len:489 (+),score=96.20 TRINITY_DN45829_c0_g1_i1:85-1551(+)
MEYKDDCIGRLAAAQCFEFVTLAVVLANAIWVAIDIDYNKAPSLAQSQSQFIIVENFFCTYFTFELAVRFLGAKRKSDLRTDAWFWFDGFLLALMITETWIVFFIVLGMGSSGETPIGKISSMLRMLRLARLARVVRLFRAVPELMTLIKAMGSALRTVLIALLLLMVTMYVFAIALVTTTEDSDVGTELFKDVPNAIYTLTRDGILPDNAPILHAFEDEGWLPTLVILLFINTATFAILNMLVGILCEVAFRVSKVYGDRMQTEFIKAQLTDIYTQNIDANSDGFVSKDEFLGIVRNDVANRAVQALGVDTQALSEQADMIFDAVDDHGEPFERRLNFSDFLDVVVSMQPGNDCTLYDINALQKFIDGRLGMVESELGVSKKNMRGSVRAGAAPNPQMEGLRSQVLILERLYGDLMVSQMQLESDVQSMSDLLTVSSGGNLPPIMEPTLDPMTQTGSTHYSQGSRPTKPLPVAAGDEEPDITSEHGD